MVETLEHLIRRAAEQPRRSRAPLCRELLRSETFLLSLDDPIGADQVTRISHPAETLAIWADRDPELGGVWVPVFPARDAVAGYVAARRLRAPRGKEFLWMGHKPGAVFSLLRGVKCFAGLRLYLDERISVSLAWSEVRALSEGRIPPENPELYELPLSRLALPAGLSLAFGTVNAGPGEPRAKLACAPEAGHFRADDTRKLVRLELGSEPSTWMACRHFLQVLRFARGAEEGGGGKYAEDLLSALVGFQMYGEAEALCEWLALRRSEVPAWLALAAIYAKTERLSDCAELCQRAAAKHPKEKSFHLSGARALSSLGRRGEALAMVQRALPLFPGDESLLVLLKDLSLPG